MDPFDEEAESIVSSVIEETGWEISKARQDELIKAIASKLTATWEDCMDMAREAAEPL